MECKGEELNNLYLSNKISDLIKFYQCFSDVEDLIKWSKSRPTAEINIYERDGNSEIIFIVPTPNINDKSTENLTKFIKNFHIIYSESHGRYFNYARSVNQAVREALKYNPKWIIISNNDIIIEDEISKLYTQLINIDNKKFSAVVGAGGKDVLELCKFNILFNLLKLSKFRYKYEILRKFKVNYYIRPPARLSKLICHPPIVEVRNIMFFGQFLIISPYYVLANKKTLFDETYINGAEDTDLFLNIIMKDSYAKVYFKLRHLVGQSLGVGEARSLRNIFNMIYLNYKINKGLIYIYKKKITL